MLHDSPSTLHPRCSRALDVDGILGAQPVLPYECRGTRDGLVLGLHLRGALLSVHRPDCYPLESRPRTQLAQLVPASYPTDNRRCTPSPLRLSSLQRPLAHKRSMDNMESFHMPRRLFRYDMRSERRAWTRFSWWNRRTQHWIMIAATRCKAAARIRTFTDVK